MVNVSEQTRYDQDSVDGFTNLDQILFQSGGYLSNLEYFQDSVSMFTELLGRSSTGSQRKESHLVRRKNWGKSVTGTRRAKEVVTDIDVDVCL